MEKKRRRVGLTVDDDLFAILEKYRNENHLMSITGAAMELIKAGLESVEAQKKEE